MYFVENGRFVQDLPDLFFFFFEVGQAIKMNRANELAVVGVEQPLFVAELMAPHKADVHAIELGREVAERPAEIKIRNGIADLLLHVRAKVENEAAQHVHDLPLRRRSVGDVGLYGVHR